MNDEDRDQSEGWWILVPVVVLGLLAKMVVDAAMTSVFDEKEE